jgi:hypothetical protein
MVQVAQALRRLGERAGLGAAAGDLQRKDQTTCAQVVLVFGQPIGSDFFFINKVVVVSIEVVDGACRLRQACWGCTIKLGVLLDPLVLGAVDKAQGAASRFIKVLMKSDGSC